MDTRCKGCWWNEGCRCYVEPVKRDENGLSVKMCDEVCDNYWSKRHALRVIPQNKLFMISEMRK